MSVYFIGHIGHIGNFLQSNIIDILIAILSHSIFNFKHLGLNIKISHSNNLFNGSLVSLIISPIKVSSKGLPSPVPHLSRVVIEGTWEAFKDRAIKLCWILWQLPVFYSLWTFWDGLNIKDQYLIFMNAFVFKIVIFNSPWSLFFHQCLWSFYNQSNATASCGNVLPSLSIHYVDKCLLCSILQSLPPFLMRNIIHFLHHSPDFTVFYHIPLSVLCLSVWRVLVYKIILHIEIIP